MNKILSVILFIFPVLLFSNQQSGEIFLGDLKNHSSISQKYTVKNDQGIDLNLTFYSLCDCLEIYPLSKSISPGDSFDFTITLSPEGYGTMTRHMLVNENGKKSIIKIWANLPELSNPSLSGGCIPCLKQEKEVSDQKNAKKILENWIIADIYYSPGCKTCEDFIKEVSSGISLNKHNILEPKELELLEKRLKKLNISLKSFPILVTNNNVLQGDNVNIEEFNKILNEEQLENDDSYIEGIEYLKPIPIFLAGLLDGINPCAFTTLLFLISSLFYIGRGKKEILRIGIIFSATIFLSYYLVGLGLLNIVRTANFFPIVSLIIKVVLIIALLFLGIFSFYDAYLVKKGTTSAMKLQLPKSLKKRIHKVIRNNTRNNGMIIGTIVIGIMVTIFELTCTGQVYLPIIAYIIKIEGTFSSYFYLTLYNIGFIIPLLIVFITVYKGTTNQKLMDWFGKKLFLIKILLGFLFLSMIPFI